MKKKVCPRCGLKMPAHFQVCGECGLNFSRVELATNKEAKKAIRLREFDRVVYTQQLPSDMNKWKLFIITLFFGWLGVHMFAVGRYFRGLVYAIVNICGLVFSIVTDAGENLFAGMFFKDLYAIIMLVWAVCVLFVFGDLLQIAFNKFKVPVALPYKKD